MKSNNGAVLNNIMPLDTIIPVSYSKANYDRRDVYIYWLHIPALLFMIRNQPNDGPCRLLLAVWQNALSGDKNDPSKRVRRVGPWVSTEALRDVSAS